MAPDISGWRRRAKSQRDRLLRSAGRRAPEERHRAVRNALSLGPAAGAAGQIRRLAVDRHVESVRRLCRLCGATTDRSSQEHLHDQRSRALREFRLWLGGRRARPQAAAGGGQPGPSQRRPRSRPCGSGNPRPRARRHAGRPGRKHHRLRAGDRHAGKHPRRRDCDKRIQLEFPGRDPGGQIHRRLPRLYRQGSAKVHRRGIEDHLVADRFRRVERLHTAILRDRQGRPTGFQRAAVPGFVPAHAVGLAQGRPGNDVLGASAGSESLESQKYLYQRERHLLDPTN